MHGRDVPARGDTFLSSVSRSERLERRAMQQVGEQHRKELLCGNGWQHCVDVKPGGGGVCVCGFLCVGVLAPVCEEELDDVRLEQRKMWRGIRV